MPLDYVCGSLAAAVYVVSGAAMYVGRRLRHSLGISRSVTCRDVEMRM